MNYASAFVYYLDLDSGTVQKAMHYPITRVELNELQGEVVVATKILVVDENGRWVEAH